MSTLIVIVGPTAVGKTAMAIRLAQYFKAEIISADSRQFYKEISIGTAKPSVEELKSVKHHFIDSHNLNEVVDAGTFEKLALTQLDNCFQHNPYMITVGGSGLFIQALCEGLDDLSLRDDELRADLSQKSLDELQLQLKELDPDYYEKVDLQNPQRLMRAIEVTKLTGKPYSQSRTGKKKDRKFKIIKIGIEEDRETLYKRIDERVDQMITDGLKEEAESVIEFKGNYALQTVGYTELFNFFEGKLSWGEAVELIKRNSRRYAKRQLTWFRRDTEIKWFNRFDDEEIIGYIKSQDDS